MKPSKQRCTDGLGAPRGRPGAGQGGDYRRLPQRQLGLCRSDLGRHRLPVTAIADTFRPKRLDDFVIAQRHASGIQTVRPSGGGAATVGRAGRNEMVILHVDRPVPGEGVRGAVLRRERLGAQRPGGHRPEDRRGHCPRLSSSAPPNRQGFAGEFDAPIDYGPRLTGDKERDIQRITQAIMSYMEGVIAAHPTQWYMFRRMWPRLDRRECRFAAVVRVLGQPAPPSTAGAPAAMRRRSTRGGGPQHGDQRRPPVIEEWASGHHPSPRPLSRPRAPPAGEAGASRTRAMPGPSRRAARGRLPLG